MTAPIPSPHPLRRGDVVIVWEDVVTRRLLEGVARLLRMVECGCPDDYEPWLVEFFHNGAWAVRYVATSDRVPMGSFPPSVRAGRRENPLAN